jgi:hypothetical protein
MQQILPKSAQSRNFEIPPKIEILVIFKNKISIYRRGTRACFHRLDFQSKNFSYAIFIVKKRSLYVNFSILPCGHWWFYQGSTPCVGMRFCGHVPNSPRNKNLKRLTLNLLGKVVFLDPKDCCPPFAGAKITFSSTLNVTISQMVRNESVRFGRHIDIQVSYKILRLEVPKNVPILQNPPCFQ